MTRAFSRTVRAESPHLRDSLRSDGRYEIGSVRAVVDRSEHTGRRENHRFAANIAAYPWTAYNSILPRLRIF